MKALTLAALATVALALSTEVIQAQSAVPITRNWRGELACPSNYVIRGGACVSIYAGRRGYNGDDGYRRGFRDSYARGRGAVQPRINWRGERQCPSNYVIRGGVCVSLY